MPKKFINFEELDVAVKASYELGLLEGGDQCQGKMNQLRVSVNQMLTVNHELFKLQQKADSLVIIPFALAEGIIKSLRNTDLKCQLRKAITKALGQPKTSDRRKDIKEETNG